MKKILLVILALALVIVAALGIFIATFNADNYRPFIVKKLSEQLGTSVELGSVSLVFKDGLALRLQDLAVYSGIDRNTKTVKIEDISASVKLLPLLSKQVQISSITIMKPVLHLERTAEGSIQLEGVRLPSGPAGGSSATPKTSEAPVSLSMDSFKIIDGQVFFKDMASADPVTLSVRHLDLTVKNFSLERPFSFDVAAAFLSSKQNLQANGSLMLPGHGGKGFVENATVKTGLADWDLHELGKILPSLRSAGIEGNIGGKMETRIDHADLGPDLLSTLKASVKLQNVAVKFASLRSPFENVQLNADLEGESLRIERFSADFAEGKIEASGQVRDLVRSPSTDIRWSSRDLSLDALLPYESANAPHLGGHLSLDFVGRFLGLAWPQISQTLSGNGKLSLKDGVLLNYNLLREVIQKISIIPGAEGVLQEQLPGIYKAKLGEPSTLFRPIEMPFVMRDGQALVQRLDLVTDLVRIQGTGQFGLDRSVWLKAAVYTEPNFSSAMSRLVPQLDIIRNQAGEIEIPMQVQGQLPHIRVLPDKDYLVQKLLSGQAQQLVTNIVNDPSKAVNQVRNLLDKPVSAGESGVKNSVQDLFGFGQGSSSSTASSNQGGTNQ